MAGGIDWFRWHHGSVTDPKFGLIAKKAGARVVDVIAVWALVLESASANDDRGTVGKIDAEAVEFLLGLDDGMVHKILDAMTQRGLLGTGGRVEAWDKRQPKREDDTAAERKRRQREREHEIRMAGAVTDEASRDVTQSHAEVTSGHDREEKSREEKEIPPTPQGGMTRFEDFWTAWPKSERKQDKVKCAQKWRRSNLDHLADQILADIAVKRQTQKWQDGYVEAPLVYLNGKRWEDGVTPAGDMHETPNALAGAI